MTDQPLVHRSAATSYSDASRARLARRYRAERRFRLYGMFAVGLAASFLVVLLGSMIVRALPAFTVSEVLIDVQFDAAEVAPDGQISDRTLNNVNFQGMARKALYRIFPEVKKRKAKRALGKILSSGADIALRRSIERNHGLLDTTVPVWVKLSDDIDLLVKGFVDLDLDQSDRRVSDREVAWISTLRNDGRIRTVFNWSFFTSGDSREPELAGVWGAVVGSFLTLFVTILISFPVGVTAAAYLEEFAPRNRWTELIEVNINNLAAVPSIVFGLLGLAVFLNYFGLPRSAPLVGGLVLALMTLPTIIIATRAALKSVPPSIREAALGVGASDLQVVMHHVVPLAMPGILTGSIIGMARALGESAPLLMIGMVAFIVDIPGSFTDPATVLPVQIYIWADSPERAFLAKTSAATVVLLAFLIFMNGLAVLLRKKFERRW